MPQVSGSNFMYGILYPVGSVKKPETDLPKWRSR
uniref:Uncharacterized protein n=1 Tax=Picea sitchensis TaxID=3332 RepID=A9NLJ6_PICSI|nr:unknown [Picea sitchensis]